MYLRRYTYIIGDTQVNDSVMTDVMKQIAKKKKVDNMSALIDMSAILLHPPIQTPTQVDQSQYHMSNT